MRNIPIQHETTYNRLRALANRYRFRIIELTQDETLSISQISKKIKLSYTKCTDYVSILEKEGLVKKTRDGREMKISGLARIKENGVEIAK
ncbi:MAG: winged helix-turn-helix domain-containing protein [Candidatus Micrarchaeia archaeon]